MNLESILGKEIPVDNLMSCPDADKAMESGTTVNYCIPTTQEFKALSIEVCCLIFIWLVVYGFTLHNICRYLVRSNKHRNWLIVAFYALSICVLTFRLLQFAFTLNLYHEINYFAVMPKFKVLRQDFSPAVMAAKNVGIFYLISDYCKYALGAFQLASMAELALVIRFSVYHMLNVVQIEEKRGGQRKNSEIDSNRGN